MKERRKKRRSCKRVLYIYIYIEKEREKNKKKKKVGCRILIGVIVANLNFSSGLVDVKLFCSG